MIHFINNIGDYFASNYFDEDFSKKVIDKSGCSSDAVKTFSQAVARIKPDYFKLKQRFIENHLRTKDKINLSHDFHTKILNALGYNAAQNNYTELYPISDKAVLPVRHILYRGTTPHLMVMEMHALIKTSDEEPDGLFEQSYNIAHDPEDRTAKEQKYHRSQWADVFTVPEGVSISPMIINQAINELFLLPLNRRPKYILLCGGNKYFLLESEKWFRGSYLELDLEALFDDAAILKDYYAVFYLLLGKDLLAPTADMVLMEQLDEDAHKAAYQVTQDLKEGVINAVENLANEAVHDLVQQGYAYDDIDANRLKDDCLNMVYRLLFLFYAESREDLDILPSNDDVYERGYSLEMLRDLEQVPLITESSRNGYFFHKSLFQLFELLNKGYKEQEGQTKSFKIRHLDSPMFEGANLNYLQDVQIRNAVWQDVICELSLSKKQNRKSRGRISYANLGINQLGSVYESLLAFRGFLAKTDYIEVHRKRKKDESSEKVTRTDGSYLVPRERLDDFHDSEIYKDQKADGSEEMKVIPRGRFIYRLSGRDRQKSASYYTPEVLTQTTVKYTLKPILERLEKGEIKALDLLDLKILEPAMGAAAFHNEVINQLAQAYLTYSQQELKTRVDPNKYQEELQKIKAHIALNNVYGVDLNPTAVELGKLSLWLNVIHKDMQTPFFGYRLGVGNAVVGSWLKVFKHKEFSFEPKGKGWVKKEWWSTAPKHLQFSKKGILRKEDEIYHFLLPDPGMAASGNIKLLKDAYTDEAKRVTEWRKEFCSPVRKDEYNLLQKISAAIDALLMEHYAIQKNIALITEVRSDFFGIPAEVSALDFQEYSYEKKQQFARERLKPNAPYYKLKQIMDYWCSLWFWDVRDAKDLPTRTQWYEDIVQILNIDLAVNKTADEEVEVDETVRDYRKDKKEIEQQLIAALKQSPSSLFENERALLVKKYADQYRYFHYELEFIEVFRERNGFDIAVGNPPWLKIVFEEKGLMSEIYPELEIRKVTAPQVKKLQSDFLLQEDRRNIYFTENIEHEASAVFMNAYQNYPLLKGQQTNLYKCVLENGLHWISEKGFLGLIHPEGIYDDPNAEKLRKEIYKRLKFHFQFQNAFNLFAEVAHRSKYGINIYAGKMSDCDFININNIFHPFTIESSFAYNGLEICHGLKFKNSIGAYEWNVTGHSDRIVHIAQSSLEILGKFSGSNADSPKLLSIHNVNLIPVIDKIAKIGIRIKDKKFQVSECWHETNDIKKGKLRKITKYPENNFQLIYSGPQFYVANPLYKNPREKCTDKSHYDIIDVPRLRSDFKPRTNFELVDFFMQPVNSDDNNWLKKLKLLFPSLLNQAGERTFQTSIIPEYSSHIQAATSLVLEFDKDLILFSGLSHSIVYDFIVKTLSVAKISQSVIENLPLPEVPLWIEQELLKRTMQLNFINDSYKTIWNQMFKYEFRRSTWSLIDKRLKPFESLAQEWSWDTPLRNYFERRQALVEIDVITAMALNLNLDELILMYNIQFPVLQQNEDDTWYDAKGNIVFTCSKGLVGVGLDRADWEKIKDLPAGETFEHTITKSELYHGEKVTYYAPFTKCDRVEDYKRAWTHFEEKFKD
ncbi:hypothetical protein SAMN05421789_11057 [Kaistella chaponensis]|uniref:site-specific DNA-methyltransferase (adenine-specific) n=1 Tax=Kaistella chaponensis TaxID=713588 RepID=A0A1N7MUL2_9FLAO|nr:hypothetical protein [Kaistella chaponensis]SIS89817.1 hypothetical protein SAMN05421789_11057 [Kaistella chaponensis]